MKIKTLLIFLFLFILLGCNRPSEPDFNNPYDVQSKAFIETPGLSTKGISNIDVPTAVSGGYFTNDYGYEITSKGICWSTNENPTINDTCTDEGGGIVEFTSSLKDLEYNRAYFVRAYATNNFGTTYGDQLNFSTNYLCGNPISDIDNNTYQTVKIGEQCWMAENLKTSKYQDGSNIANVTNSDEWSNLSRGAWAYYLNDSSNNTIYGKLYNWFSVNDNRGLCPVGWRVPSKPDWDTIERYLGNNAGGRMKVTGTEYWSSPNAGATNDSGFGALPSGRRDIDGEFKNLTYGTNWWSSSSMDSENAWQASIGYKYEVLVIDNRNKKVGRSIRCILE